MKSCAPIAALAMLVTTSGVIMAMEGQRWFGAFTAYPQVRELCDEHVSAERMHLTWRSYATRDPLAKVVGFYERDQKTSAIVDEKGGERKFVAGSAADTILSLYSVSAAASAKVPTCSNGATREGENTVILVSQAARAPR